MLAEARRNLLPEVASASEGPPPNSDSGTREVFWESPIEFFLGVDAARQADCYDHRVMR